MPLYDYGAGATSGQEIRKVFMYTQGATTGSEAGKAYEYAGGATSGTLAWQAEQIVVPNQAEYPVSAWLKIDSVDTLSVGNSAYAYIKQTYDEPFGVKTRGICIGLNVTDWDKLNVTYQLVPGSYPASVKLSSGYGTGGANVNGFKNATFWYSAWPGTTQSRTDTLDLSGKSGTLYLYFGMVDTWGDHGVSMEVNITSMVLS